MTEEPHSLANRFADDYIAAQRLCQCEAAMERSVNGGGAEIMGLVTGRCGGGSHVVAVVEVASTGGGVEIMGLRPDDVLAAATR